jgi:hypothetical protein
VIPDVDARLLNWRFIVPAEPKGLLLLPAGAETLPGAVTPGKDPSGGPRLPDPRYPAIAAPDLAAWLPRGRRGGAACLLADLAAAVAPGGWLCAGFANRWYPLAPLRPGSLSSGRALRTIRRAGLTEPQLYAALPGQRRAAFLVPLARRAEMDYMLRFLFQTSTPERGRGAVAFRRILRALRLAALLAPRARRHLVPAYYLIAQRPR